MVNSRLSQLIFLYAILFFNNYCFASAQNNSPQLILFTDKSQSTLGRPIRVEIYGVSLASKIEDIKLNRLRENFGVVTDYITAETSDIRWPNQTIQILRLKLYPRKTGEIVIPSVSANKIKSREKTMIISKGKTGLPEMYLSEKEPYENQQIIVQVSITSYDSTSRLSIEDNPELNNFEITPLAFKRTKKQNGIYILKTGWALTALKNGLLKLELPPIEYSVSGVSRKKFYLPATTINIKALPSYLPHTIPVGKISIQSQLLTESLLQPDTLSYWNIKLSGNINNSYRLPPILRQLKSNNHVKFLPVNSKRSVQSTENSLTSTVNHSIPYKALGNGFLNLPAIQLQYFDPYNGKIKTLIYHADEVFVLNYFWRGIFGVFIVILLIYIFNFYYKKWQQIKFSKLKRAQAMQLLQDCNDIEEIRESIRLFAEAEYWPSNITLNKWCDYWGNKYHVTNNFKNLMNALSSVFYGAKDQLNSKELSLELLKVIENRKKL